MVSTSKAVLSEVSDDSNQAFGITILGAASGAGYILGPAVASVVADPVGQYNLTLASKCFINTEWSIAAMQKSRIEWFSF